MIVDQKDFNRLSGRQSPEQQTAAILTEIARLTEVIASKEAPTINLPAQKMPEIRMPEIKPIEVTIPPVRVTSPDARPWEFTVERDQDGRLKKIIAKPL